MAARSTPASRSKDRLAADVWRLMASFTFERFKRAGHMAILARLGLTPGHMRALVVLDPAEPRSMRALADAIGVDASSATWLVDRLEERGLAERRPHPDDRRVKTIVLTSRGIAVRDQLRAALYEPPPELLALDMARLQSLRRSLEALPASAGIMGEIHEPADDAAPPAAASPAPA
jgi:DNA-binding MarR family transcriptional regulator